MTQVARCNGRNFVMHGRLLPEGEIGVLVCLMAVPLTWTVLIAAMVSTCTMVTTTALLLAGATGCGAVAARLVWSHRHVER